MFSSMIETIIVVAKAQLKIAEENLKKSKRKLKDEEEGKKSPKDIVEHKKEEDKDPEKKEKEVKKKKIKVNAEFVKVQALRVKILVLQVIKYIVMIIEQFVMFLIATFGALGLFIVLVVLVLMIAIYGFLHIDMTVPNGEILNSNGSNHYENCIQGGKAISNIGFDLNAMGQLQGTMTEYEKQLFQLLGLYEEILSLPSDKVLPDSEKMEKSKEILGKDNVLKYLFGFSATESGLNFQNDKKDILLYPSKTDNGEGYGFLGLNMSFDFNGTYGSATVLNDEFLTFWKEKYKPIENPICENNFVPYGVATQLGCVYTTYISSWESVKEVVEPIMDKYGIQENREKLIAYCQLFGGTAAYHGGGANENLYSLWCALWSATSNEDSKRSFDNITIIYENENDFSENTARSRILGTGFNNYLGMCWDEPVVPYFEINETKIDVTLWTWVKNNCSNPEYFNETIAKWLDEKATKTVILNGHYGLIGYLMSNRVINNLGGSVPIVVGGNAEDCDCYTSTINRVADFSNVKAGEVQGNWSEEIKTILMSEDNSITQYYGQANALINPDEVLSGYNITVEEWRQRSKWKMPYYFQDDNKVESSKNALDEKVKNLPTMGEAGCHIYMFSTMASYLTGKVINPTEMTVALFHFDALSKDGGTKGWNQSRNTYKAFNDLGLKFISLTGANNNNANDVIDGGNILAFENYFNLTALDLLSVDSSTLQRVVNTILDKNGVIGVAGAKDYFTTGSNHYVVISERTSDGKYKVVGYNPSGIYPHKNSSYSTGSEEKGVYDWNFIYKAMCEHTNAPTFNTQRFYAYNPNLTSIQVVNNNNTDCISSNNRVGNLVETKGQYQGFGDISSYVENLGTNSNFSTERFANVKSIAAYVGYKPKNEGNANVYNYVQDKWTGNIGIGMVRYCQWSYDATDVLEEDWGLIKHGDSSLTNTGCGAFTTSAVASTLLKKYINPPEVLMAALTYPDRHGGEGETTFANLISGSRGVFNREMQQALLEELGLKVDKKSLTQDSLDMCLNNNGMVIVCLEDRDKGKWFTDEAHYVVIREKTKDGTYLIYSPTNWKTCPDSNREKACDFEFTYADLGMVSGEVLYVTL